MHYPSRSVMKNNETDIESVRQRNLAAAVAMRWYLTKQLLGEEPTCPVK